MVIRGLYGVCSERRKTGKLLVNSSGDIESVEAVEHWAVSGSCGVVTGGQRSVIAEPTLRQIDR